MKGNIIVVEDDSSLQTLVTYVLEKEEYSVRSFTTGEDALASIQDNIPDVILLDILLPGMNGYEVCKELKKNPAFSDITIIMFTQKDSEEEISQGLTTYADDYITKPFSPTILIARITAAIRRKKKVIRKSDAAIIINNVAIDEDARSVFVNDEEIYLTRYEFDILLILANSPNRPKSREYIIENIRDLDDPLPHLRAVDNYIYQIRKKLKNAGICIETVQGIGYVLKTD